MNPMKRILSFVLCAALLLSLAPAALAQSAEPVNALLFISTDETNRNVSASAVAGGALYMLVTDYNANDESRDAFYVWKPGDAEPVKAALELLNADTYETKTAATLIAEGKVLVNKLFADGDTLYGLCASTGDLWKLADASGLLAKPEAMPKLDWSAMMTDSDGYSYAKDVSNMTVMDGKLYAVVTDWDKPTAAERKSVCSWELATGAAGAPITGQLVISLTPYKDGKFLCKVQDEDNSWDAQKQQSIPADIGVLDPAAGKVEKLMTSPDSSMACLRYSAESGMAYYVSTTEITRLNLETGETAISAYLPHQVWDDTSMYLWGGMAAVITYSGAYVRALDLPSVAAGALTIYGEYGSNAHMAFVATHPDMAVNSSESYFSTLDGFTNAMVSGDGTLDVARLNGNYSPLSRLIDKGYAMDLSAYTDLADYVNTMDSRFTDFCKRDGKLYAVPVDMSATMMGYNADAWKELGLTEDDLPTSFMGLLDFVENWTADYGEDHPEYKLFDDTNSKNQLLNWMMNTYVTYRQSLGESASFDTELFRKLLTKLEQIDFTEIDPAMDANGGVSDSDQDEFWSRDALFNFWGDASSLTQYKYEHYLVLPLDDGLEPVITAGITALIINPRTTRVEQAVEYLRSYVHNLSANSANIVLFPENNEPLVNSTFERDLANWQESLATLTEKLDTANPEDVPAMKESISYWEEQIANSDQYRYEVSAEVIAQYREQIAPYLVVTGQTVLNTWSENGENEFYSQMQQYAQGAITLDQFVKEIDKRIRMMELEDQ